MDARTRDLRTNGFPRPSNADYLRSEIHEKRTTHDVDDYLDRTWPNRRPFDMRLRNGPHDGYDKTLAA